LISLHDQLEQNLAFEARPCCLSTFTVA